MGLCFPADAERSVKWLYRSRSLCSFFFFVDIIFVAYFMIGFCRIVIWVWFLLFDQIVIFDAFVMEVVKKGKSLLKI